MNDFEVHPRGTANEIALSRKLVQELTDLIETYQPGILPVNVLRSYNSLIEHYNTQMENV